MQETVVNSIISFHLIQFIKDYCKLVKPYVKEHLSKKIPSLDELRSLAEQEFINSYGLIPTCAVFVPGCLTIAGKSANLVESKSLSMVGANSIISAMMIHRESRLFACTITEYVLSYDRATRKQQ